MRNLQKVLSTFCIVSTAAFGAVETGVNDHIIFSNNEKEVGEERLNLLMHEAHVRADVDRIGVGIGFTNRFTTNGDRKLNEPFLLEKKLLSYTTDEWELKAGDSYQEIGRGIALSLYRDPVFGLDTTVEGVSLRYRPDFLDATVFGGRVNAMRAPVAINPVETSLIRNDLYLAGSSIKAPVAEGTKLGAHYLFAANKPKDAAPFDRIYHTVGASAEVEGIADAVDAYVESNVLTNRSLGELGQSLPTGYGTYASAVWSPTPWQAKLEVKDYRDYDFEFRRPPTLEEDIIESINISDVSAARLYGEHRNTETKTTWLASYLLGRDRLVQGTIHHGVVGTRFIGPLGIEFEIKTGYRTLPGKSNVSHAFGKGKIKTLKGQALELSLRKQYQNDGLDILPAVTDRNVMDVTYVFSETFNVSLGYEYRPSNDVSIGQNFFNVGGVYKTGPLTARAFGGKTGGGTVCSGGVCRQVPPFTGAYLETHYVF